MMKMKMKIKMEATATDGEKEHPFYVLSHITPHRITLNK